MSGPEPWESGADFGGKSTASLGMASVGLGVAGLVLLCCCGWFTILFGIGAIGLGIAARQGEDGKALGTAGIALGALDIVLFVVMMVLGIGLQVASAILGNM